MSESFILYTSYYAIIEELTDEQLGQLLRALFVYARDGKTIKLDPVIKMAFSFIQDDLDRNIEKYKKKCERNRANIRKRWNTKNTDVYERIQSNTKNTDVYERSLYDNDNDNDNDNDTSNDVDNITPLTSKRRCETEVSHSLEAAEDKNSSTKRRKANIDCDALKDYWNEQHDRTESSMKRLTMMSEKRKTMIRARLRQCCGDMAMLYQAIDTAMASDFMNGNNKRGWTASFDWIFGSENNFAKTLDGYDDTPARKPKPPKGESQEPSIGEIYRQEQQPKSKPDKRAEQIVRYQGLIEALKQNPKSFCRGALVSAYNAGTLKRLGIEWEPD